MKIKQRAKGPFKELPFALGIPALIWQTLFFYIPLCIIVISSFLLVSPLGKIEGWTFSHIVQFFSPVYFKVILASLSLALGTACICFIIAFPLAYYMAFRGRKHRNMLLFFLIVPFWTNFLLHVYAWFYVLENHGFLNNILMKIGMISEPLHLLNTVPAILIMMVYYYLPFMVLPLYTSLEKFNFTLIEASYDLGANFTSTLRRILLPLVSGGIRAGFFLVFIPAFGEFAIPELMGGDKKMFVGTVVSQYILGEGTGSLGAAFTLISGVVLILATIVLYFFLSKLFTGRNQHG